MKTIEELLRDASRSKLEDCNMKIARFEKQIEIIRAKIANKRDSKVEKQRLEMKEYLCQT